MCGDVVDGCDVVAFVRKDDLSDFRKVSDRGDEISPGAGVVLVVVFDVGEAFGGSVVVGSGACGEGAEVRGEGFRVLVNEAEHLLLGEEGCEEAEKDSKESGALADMPVGKLRDFVRVGVIEVRSRGR